jgi:hypothetical protein
MSKIVKNQELVPLMGGFGDGDCAFDQPCKFGYRVESHSVYCDNEKSGYRKCHASWYHGRAISIIDKCADEDCKYFKPNPNFIEDKDELAKEVTATLKDRKKRQDWHNKKVAEGWLCPKCKESFGCNDKTTLCLCGTLVTGMVKIKDGKQYTDEEVDLHFTHNPMDVPIRKECPCFSIQEI